MNLKTNKMLVPFTQVSNDLLNHKGISLKAKGIYCFMFSKPHGWNFTIKSMSKQLLEGERSISTAIQELKETGWISYSKNNDGTGLYSIHIEPKLQNDDLVNVQNSNMLKPTSTKRSPINNKDYNNKDLSINNENSLFSKEEIKSIPEMVIDYLNKKLKSKRGFQKTNSNLGPIKTRIKEGAKLEDFKKVIDLKYDEWIGEEKTKVWLRPSTLFGNKFDSYIVQAEAKAVSNDGSDNFVFNPTSLKDAML